MTDEEIKETVMKHEYEFQTLAKSLSGLVKELHEITTSIKTMVVLQEKMSHLETTQREGFMRVHDRIGENEEIIKAIRVEQNKAGCPTLNLKGKEIDQLNRTVYGKDGRGGLVFSDLDTKKFMYKLVGFMTAINLVAVMGISIFIK